MSAKYTSIMPRYSIALFSVATVFVVSIASAVTAVDLSAVVSVKRNGIIYKRLLRTHEAENENDERAGFGGLTTWSPLATGALTGKYGAGTPESSRMANPLFKSLSPDFAERVAKADKLKPLAEKLGISMAELAVAWCVSNENVSTVMIGAKTMEQLEQNLKAVEALEKITSDVKAEIDSLVPFVPELSKSIGSEMTRGHFL
ncbi:hypothetical protein F441_14718 [Phytophthora nicotianae CJ01A1]|uniref:NADP-dependent oxidoreductase domain-containing protein n=1 Tax=Phytophthora nicotianae CJ01A1 TaxID=1317063 RepID=W2WFP2_PHYNI|nr:hypothetical protein F441_14718 [Phytophthora nicotianae CJ01A1]